MQIVQSHRHYLTGLSAFGAEGLIRLLIAASILWLVSPPSIADTIHDYAKRGDVVGITAMLEAGSNVNDFDGLGTPLTDAVKRGHYAAAELLIARGARVNASTMYYGEPIMLATRQLRIDLVKLLLEHGASPNSTHEGEPVLNVAAGLGCLECVKALVEAGADVNWETKACGIIRTALGISEFYRYDEISAYLKARGAKRSTWMVQRE